MNSSIIRRGLPVVLAVVLLAYALKDISFSAIGNQFQRANYSIITLVGLLTAGSYLLRGKRWQQPLWALGYHPTAFRTTVAMQTGIIASMIVLGSGELTRCVTLQRTDGIPVSQGVGSVVAERIIDLFMLMLVFLLTLILEFNRMQVFMAGLAPNTPSSYLLLLFVGGLATAGVVGWWLLSRPAVRQHRLTQKLFGLIRGFGQGFMAIRQLPQPGLFIFLTLLNQLLAWLSAYLLLLAVYSTHNIPPTAALTILAVSSLGGLAVPTQGGIGTYHFLVSRALVLYGFSAEEGAVTATFMHAVSFGINLLLSSVSFLIVPVLITNRRKRQEASLVK